MDIAGSKTAQWAGWAFWGVYCSLFLLVLAATLSLSPLKDAYDWRYLLHIGAGTIYLGLAPFQFIGAIRRRYPVYHRIAGRILVGAGLLAILATFAIHTTPLGTQTIPSQTILLLIWLVSLIAAVWCIRHGDVVWHQRHMARGLVAGSYFLMIRIFDRFIGAEAILSFETDASVRLANSDWLGWIVPMLAVELFMVLTTGGKGRPRPGST